MKSRTGNRFILFNVLITITITALVGFIVIQGLLSIMLSNEVDSLSSKSYSANTLISLSVSGASHHSSPEDALKENAVFLAEKISSGNSLSTVIFDTNGAVLAQSDDRSDYTLYSADAVTVAREGRDAYIYTVKDQQNLVIYFSPVTYRSETLGVLMFSCHVSAMEVMSTAILRLFLIAGAIGAAASTLLYMFSHRRLLRPIRQITDFFSRKISDPTADLPVIDRERGDEVDTLIRTYEDMQESISETISELDMERSNFKNIVSSLQDAVFTASSDGSVLYTNTAADILFSRSRPEEMIPDYQGMIALASRSHGRPSTETDVDGRTYLIMAVPVKRMKEDDAVMFVVRDISAVRHAEEEQNRFISSVSHELKTPLTTIIGYTDLLKRRGTGNRQVTDKALDTIEEESRRLQRLVDDLLQIGKMNSYEFELVLTDVDLDSILTQVCSQMSLTGEKRGIPVLYDSRDVPLVRGDGDRLRQCFLNIIDNAVKYSNDNEPVRVTAVGMGDHVEITVRDYAEGIPSDKKDKVFEPFYRVEDDRRRIDSSGGYGLGLSIVKNIITRHGGTITIDSEEEMGTLVSVKLPARGGKEAADERKN